MCNRPTQKYSENTYLGLDLGSQKLKAVILNSKLEIIFSTQVHFDVDFPEYGTTGGAKQGDNPDEYLVNPTMWVKALHVVFSTLHSQGADLHSVAAISGSAQQHGSVFWSEDGFKRLCGLNCLFKLHEQLNEYAFSVLQSPMWMDGSTGQQCSEMERTIGGALEMSAITGSKCYARFTGPQIRKIYQTQPEKYENTVRISLVSSFLTSVLLGTVAAIDFSDGSGMNLLDIRKKKWSSECLDACAPDLARRLMKPIAPNRLQGRVAKYFVERWNFRPDCMVLSCTGDNPSSLAGMLLEKNSLILSLGTSDTIIMHLKHAPKLEEGHVLCHPTIVDEYMGLLCFRNGSLVRQTVCQEVANGSWNTFNHMLETTPMGNYGNIAVHFHDREIIPLAKGILKWNKDTDPSSKQSRLGLKQFEEPAWEARAVVEGQMMHHRIIASEMGFHFDSDTKIIVIGGASKNRHILQIVADVFNASVYETSNAEMALLGAAYRARYAFYEYREANCSCRRCKMPKGRRPKLSYTEFFRQALPNTLKLVASPTPGCEVYEPLLPRYEKMTYILAARTAFSDYQIVTAS
ncbi:xylulose kinase [Scaptodrosophila lebanonensis]|uniref:Xylulose kinase n=1 Tax=Drosophila lebanonensis TaxID=7225 RepID=A0A6J2U7A9_DROLE|nr:xylulose kinase [Scaptodrosophila lebanonensis]